MKPVPPGIPPHKLGVACIILRHLLKKAPRDFGSSTDPKLNSDGRMVGLLNGVPLEPQKTLGKMQAFKAP